MVVAVVLVGATLVPLARRVSSDSFPFSTYPMFAVPRPTSLTLAYGLGLTATGDRRPLAPRLAGTGEVLQAAAVFDDAVNGGTKTLAPLCTKIAERIAAEPSLDDIAFVRIVTGTHDALDYLLHDTLGRETERWRCRVTRTPR